MFRSATAGPDTSAIRSTIRWSAESTNVIGARNEEQFRQNLAAAGWLLSPGQIAALDRASKQTPIYPYWHQWRYAERNPLPVAHEK